MGYIIDFDQDDANRIADIIVSFSIIDDMLCGFIIEYNKKTGGKKFANEANQLKTDKSIIGIGKKINCFLEVFPNHPAPDGNNIKEIKSILCNLRNFRVAVAHERRFSTKNGVLSFDHKQYSRAKPPLSKIHELYVRNFRKLDAVLNVYYSDWEFRDYYLYDINGEECYE